MIAGRQEFWGEEKGEDGEELKGRQGRWGIGVTCSQVLTELLYIPSFTPNVFLSQPSSAMRTFPASTAK